MQLAKVLPVLVCRYAAILFLLGGFALAKTGWGVILTLALALFGSLPRRARPNGWSSARLVGSVGIAAGGILSGVSPQLLLAGVTAALAAWELEDEPPDPSRQSGGSALSPYERLRLSTLGCALSLGLVAGEAGALLEFHLPFGVQFFLALVVLVSISRLFWSLKRALKTVHG